LPSIPSTASVARFHELNSAWSRRGPKSTTAADVRWKTPHAWHAAGWRHQPAARQHLTGPGVVRRISATQIGDHECTGFGRFSSPARSAPIGHGLFWWSRLTWRRTGGQARKWSEGPYPDTNSGEPHHVVRVPCACRSPEISVRWRDSPAETQSMSRWNWTCLLVQHRSRLSCKWFSRTIPMPRHCMRRSPRLFGAPGPRTWRRPSTQRRGAAAPNEHQKESAPERFRHDDQSMHGVRPTTACTGRRCVARRGN
jgi:hypothetical protein